MSAPSHELGSETREAAFTGRKIQSLDDLTREIADRRLHSEFGGHIAPEKSKAIREIPDRIENPKEFADTARRAGLEVTARDLGYSTQLETPAHVRKGDVGKEIGTLIHEDLHRVTHPDTLREMRTSQENHDFYEGVTQYFTSKAVEGLPGFQSGEYYPEQTEAARQLASEVGDKAMRDWFFKHEFTEGLHKALDQIPHRLKMGH